ncbi:hypothetical protein [Polyangium spumosum]|uniref:DUF4276 family protein n=1 Tax=Polyangium spumosum TaxID=889282 RepID=A0A6N7PQI7_9BACT|nr:hypothetical protein [Polyangium spumosum]MRG94243.1 hypothetical protein [Polyangium spumosum]
MARVIRIGYFCTGGQTELGARTLESGVRELTAIDAFLRKISPEIAWERAFPAREKPGPKHKPGSAPASFKHPSASGVTGRTLERTMRERLEKYYRGADCKFDAIVLIDDADCRFRDDAHRKSWLEEREQEVRESTARPELPFVALLASPEVESWLLADWEEGFGQEYDSIQVNFCRALEQELLGERPWVRVEAFGGPFDPQKGSCTRKLSTEIQKVLERLAMEKGEAADRRTYTYSKRENGPDMLRRIRPDKAAETCRLMLRPAILALRDLARRASQDPSS